MKKSYKLVLTTTVALSVLGACSQGKDDPQKSDKPLTVWTTSNVEKENVEKWGKENSKKVDAVVIPWDDYQTKLKQSVSDPKTAPDIFAVAKDFVKEWSEKEGTILNLEKEFSEDIEKYKENVFNGIDQLGSSPSGTLVSVTNQYPVGVMFYNRKIAKEILGTDDPEKVSEAMGSLDKWSDVNKKIKDKYGDKTKLLGTFGDTSNMLTQQRTKPYVEGDTFTIGKEIADIFDEDKKLYEEKMFLSEIEDEAYQAGYNQDTFFVNFNPSWAFASKIKPQIEGKESAGHWGVATPPFSYTRGGTWYFITAKSGNKKEAWDYIKSQTTDTANLVPLFKEMIDFPSSKPAAQELVDSNYEEPLLGNQKVFSLFGEQAKIQEDTFKDIVTKYDGAISSTIAELVMDYGNGTRTKEDALKELGERMKNAYPDLKVKEAY